MPNVSHDEQNGSSAPNAHRRTHRKSRTGCGNCKKRRVKCDETKPECHSCVTFGVPCDYTAGVEPLREASPQWAPVFLNSHGPQSRAPRGRPRTRWRTADKRASASLSPASAGRSEIPRAGAATDPTVASIEHAPPAYPSFQEEQSLLEHFLATGFENSGNNPNEDPLVYRAPKLGLKYPFVLHLVYEFTALSLARRQTCQERQEYYRTLAAHHSDIGLTAVAPMLSRIDDENCHAIYTAAVFACINAFARGPQENHYLLFTDHGSPQWLPMLWGIRTIIDLIGIERIVHGPDAEGPPVKREPPQTIEPAVNSKSLLQLNWADQFARLRHFVETGSNQQQHPETLRLCTTALERLQQCYEAVYGIAVDGSYEGNADHQNIFIWTYRLEEEFANLIQQRHSVALMIVAHFAVLLKSFEFVWYLKGWAEQILLGVRRSLIESLQDLVLWPEEQLKLIDRAGRSGD